jgi:hypothetical protein
MNISRQTFIDFVNESVDIPMIKDLMYDWMNGMSMATKWELRQIIDESMNEQATDYDKETMCLDCIYHKENPCKCDCK